MLDVRVQPGAGRNGVELAEDGTVRVRVKAQAERGKANDAVVALLARRLGVGKSSVAIVRGRTARRKLVRVDGLTAEQVRSRLAG